MNKDITKLNMEEHFMAHPVIDNSIKFHKDTIPVNIYRFYLSDNIVDSSRYIEMINILKTAEEHDTVYLYINNTGGELSTAIQIITAMNESSATIITSLEGEACSAATMIFLSGQQFVINANCSFMIHYYSTGLFGKGNDVETNILFNRKYFKELYMNIYRGFLTEDEVISVIDGRDIWLTSSEVEVRVQALIEYRQEEQNVVEKVQLEENLNNITEYSKELKEKIKELS